MGTGPSRKPSPHDGLPPLLQASVRNLEAAAAVGTNDLPQYGLLGGLHVLVRTRGLCWLPTAPHGLPTCQRFCRPGFRHQEWEPLQNHDFRRVYYGRSDELLVQESLLLADKGDHCAVARLEEPKSKR